MYRLTLILLLSVLIKFNNGGPVQKLDTEEDVAPLLDAEPQTEDILIKNDTDNGNSTSDLFVIKTVVYEIGILTNSGNDTDFDNETHEEIDLAFFDPESNGTFVDLSRIPIPVQTNVSGVSITGILPANFGNLALLNDGTPTLNGSQFPLFPNKQVKISHNISTLDADKTNSVLEGLPEILGLKDILKHKKHDSSSEEDNSDESSSKEKTDWEKKLEKVDTEEIE